MNIRGALKKAQEMFGPKALVQARKCSHCKQKPGRPPLCSGVGSHIQPCPGGLPYFSIGRIMLGMFNEINGEGMSWEEAFARAEAAQHRNGCRRCWRKRPCRPIRAMEKAIADLRDKEVRHHGLWWSIREGA